MEYSFQPPTNESDFENFCRRLLKSYWAGSDPQLYGRKGQTQDGVDIIDMSGREPLRAAQCKHRSAGKVLTSPEVIDEVEKARAFTPAIGQYCILTTSSRSTQVQRTVLELNREHQRQGIFRIVVLTWDLIEEILREYPGLWDEIVDPPVKRALEPVKAEIDAIGRRLDVVVARTVEDEDDAKLESARQRLEEHDRQAAKLILRQLRANRWSELSGRQRFLTLTYLAKVEHADGKWCEAGRLFLEAKEHQPDDERSRINEALGYELAGNAVAAYKLARELANAFPRSSRL